MDGMTGRPHTEETERMAGRELDALVAEKVMGWRDCRLVGMWTLDGMGQARPVGDDWQGITARSLERPVPHFSTLIASAWEVVDKMQDFSCDFELEKAGDQWYANFKTGAASGSTAPLAICLAALRAMEPT